MNKWEPGAAAAVVGIASYNLWNAWQSTAPSLADLRKADPSDIGVRQKLLDANLTVGTLAFVIAVTLAILTKDITVCLIMAVFFITLTMWHNAVLNAEPR
jgi:Flp pilus assembly protein TadB